MADIVKPQVQFTYTSNTGLQAALGPPESTLIEKFSSSEQVRTFRHSPKGTYVAWVLSESVKIYNTNSYELEVEIPLKNVIEIEWSPRETYISTWERFVKGDGESEPHKNMRVWNVETAEQVIAFTQKSQNNWNVLWTEDEVYCSRLVSGELQVHDANNFSKGVWSRLKLEGISSVSVSPGKRPTIATFVPERKGQPAMVRLYDLTNFNQPLAQKTFFRADSAQFIWNSLGTNILVLTHTDVDKTGQSYYGETSLYYLAIAGNYDCRVDLDKPGPIHDVAWAPNSKEFIVVYGTTPAKATLFDHRANPIYDFPAAPRNFVRFNPHGRVIVMAGFGNLAGEMEFWDRKTLRKISTVLAANSSFCEWCPDGRHLMTATLYRRLKVDNGVRIWHYQGVLVQQVDVKELYQVEWRPATVEAFPERATLSPAPSTGVKVQAPAKPVGVYRPPGARGAAAPAIFARGTTTEALTDSKNSSAKTVPGFIPGQPSDDKPLSKAALKNKKKREAKKKKEEEATETASPTTNGSAPAPSSTTTPAAATKISTLSPAEREKRIKNLNKKLRQIAEIKGRIAAGEKLELTQLKKVEGEEEIRKELSELTLG
ncbi:hypothetical protein HK102_006976 [Quaeritorhiza haematococci]|nr:hypothetical protein HK102_006976 [Quaeritorhiza haematococci]